MKILSKAFGTYGTNCYIVFTPNGEFIIDCGVGATNWVCENVKNPIAILNTHGHFDHVWSNAEISKKLNIPIYIHKNDAFMLKNDPLGFDVPPSEALLVEDEDINIGEVDIKFILCAGHTQGSCIIKIGDNLFTGDFIFKGAIGRVDFPFSNPTDMRKSLEKFLEFKDNLPIYAGHGDKSDVFSEQKSIKYLIQRGYL